MVELYCCSQSATRPSIPQTSLRTQTFQPYIRVTLHTATHNNAVPYAGGDIHEFLHYFRWTFPDSSITPKMHMLEDHVVPLIRKWMGMLNEQGDESIHVRFNTIHRTYGSMPKCTVQEHFRQVCLSPECQLQREPSKVKSDCLTFVFLPSLVSQFLYRIPHSQKLISTGPSRRSLTLPRIIPIQSSTC